MSEDFFMQDLVGDFDDDGEPSWQYARPDTRITPDALRDNENVLSQIPEYVVDYAPLVHLYSGEEYWPCNIDEHLYHITPELNFTPVQTSWQHPRLNNLSALNRWEYGRHVFLTSNDNVEDHPEWLRGEKNIPAAPPPSSQGFKDATEKTQGGRSDAPAILVVVNKGHGIVDAFWFFFYSFNLGNVVVLRFGNHVGDWEHSLVRFYNGKPKAIFVSEHFFGQAYSYRAVEKSGKRPVIYSATGTHAMYATAGRHAYILPRTKARYGILLKTRTCIHMIFTMIYFDHPTLLRMRRRSGFILLGTGATSSILLRIQGSMHLRETTTMSVDPWVLSSRISVEGRFVRVERASDAW